MGRTKLIKMRLRTGWLITTLLSIVVALGFYIDGKLEACGPKEVDGQCGMGPIAALVFGIFAGATIFITMTVYFLIAARRRRTLPPGKQNI
jgi:hypothetical protein